MINVGVEHNGCELLRELAVKSILQLIGEDFYEEHLPGRQGSMIEHQYLALGDLEEQRGMSVHSTFISISVSGISLFIIKASSK